MKKFNRFPIIAILALFGSLFFTSCNDPLPEPEPEPEPKVEKYFDIWVRAGSSGNRSVLVKNVPNLNAQASPIDFLNSGADVTAKLDEEIIFKDGYYYQIPTSGDRFGKYQIYDGKVTTIAEVPFGKNTYSTYRYSFTWLNDSTLTILAANGAKNKVLWTKLRTTNMTILSEGELDLKIDDGLKFSTSGLARYRSDGYIIYLTERKGSFVDECFYAVFIKADDMTVRNEVKETRSNVMAGTAYGELLQDKMFFDENENLYVACNTKRVNADSYTEQYGQLLRINNKEFDFDKNYLGHNYPDGKLITATYMGNNKAIIYIQDPTYTNAAGWGNNYNCYLAMLDLKTDQKTEFQYQGAHLPYSMGTFAQFAVVRDGKAYLATNPEHSEPTIYIYDIASGTIEKGLSLTEGYTLTRIGAMSRPIE